MIFIISMNQPTEQSARSAATNSYFTYAKPYARQQRRYVKSRTPAPVKRRVKKAATRAVSGSKGVLKIAECTAHYLTTIMNPFDSPAGACLPADLFPLPSQKLKVFARGTCVLGTTGYGYCNAALCLSNNTNCSVASTSTSVMTSATLFNAVTNVTAYQFVQLPWSTTDVANDNVEGRGVALGLRVRYAGTEAGRNGTMVFYEDPDHISTGLFSYDLLTARVNAYTCRPPGDGSWETVLYSGPVTPSETEFRNVDALTVNGGGVLVCAIKGVAGDTYEFEVFEHIEAIGKACSGKTPSHSDSMNYGKAQETLKNESGIKSLSVRDGPSVISQFVHKVVELAPFVIEQGSNIMKALEGDPMALLSGMASSAGLVYRSIAGRGDYQAAIGSQALRSAPVQRVIRHI